MVRMLLVPALLAVTACAADTAGGDSAASAGADCFTMDSVTAYNRANFDTLYVQTGAGTYRVDLAGACSGMEWTDAIREARGGAGVCLGANAGGGDPYNTAARCTVTRVSSARNATAQMTPVP